MKPFFLKKSMIIILVLLNSMLVQSQNSLLINNVQIFNGKDEKTMNGNVLIVNNLISKISTAAIPINNTANTKVIDGKGKFLMPGLIDAHTHVMM